MSDERDPRVDPRPGDAAENDRLLVTVISRNGYDLICRTSRGDTTPLFLWTWQSWARNATVEHKA